VGGFTLFLGLQHRGEARERPRNKGGRAMKVQVSENFVRIRTIEVPDEAVVDRKSLQDWWCENQPKSVLLPLDIDWSSTEFTGPEGQFLGDIS